MKLKISRLFHWLYATLMFLPILMFIPSCLYYGFNEHAVNESTTQINYKYQSNEVNTLDDLVLGNIYYLDTFNVSFYENMPSVTINVISLESISNWNEDATTVAPQYDELFNYQNDINNYFKVNFSGLNEEGYLYYTNGDLSLSFDFYNGNFNLNKVIFYCNEDFNNLITYLNYKNYLPQYTDYNVIESVDTNLQDTISNKMYLAWEGVWNLPLFQWTKNSFITAPFSYITGLFGLSSDNSLNCVFTYFASISICWLVFDLIMYVPNLAHRWLDRSAIE